MSMLVIGLTGGIASGKSFVAKCFEQLGAEILDADKIGHEVLDLPDVVSQIQATWPQVEIINQRIDRKSLAQVVFEMGIDRRRLNRLEAITHPLIKTRIEGRLTELRDNRNVAAVLDVPLLFEAGWESMCDKIVFVDVDLQIRIARAFQTRGWDADEITRRKSFLDILG